jgi:multidrug efflux system outer membrane protein
MTNETRRESRRSRFRVFQWTCLALLAATLGACKMGADYRRPDLQLPGDYKSPADGRGRAANELATNWWTLFDEPQLTVLEEAATRYNPDLQAAMQRVVQARELARGVQSQFFPVVTFDPSYRRSRAPGSTNPDLGRTTNSYQIPFDLSYEVDLWGRIARGYESSKAQAEATAAAYFVVLQTLQADVAQNYFNLRSLDTQAQILAENVELYRSQLALVVKQNKAGLAPPTDVVQVEALLHATESQHLDVLRQRADVEHALAVLTGRPPSELTIPQSPEIREPPVIPPGLPMELLRRRPDVAQAEQGLRAANADIGAAQADFLPRLTLSGAAGFESINLRSMLDWQSRVWSFGPSLSMPIFEGGRLTSQLRQARARYNEQLANYRSTVLTAFREVEDSLSDLHFRWDQAEAQRKAVESSREYLRLAVIQRERGGFLTPFQSIDADRTLLQNQLAEAQIRNERLIATVLLIKALGGGWEASPASFRTDSPLTKLPEHSPSAKPDAKVPPLPVIQPQTQPAPATLPAPLPATEPAMVPRTMPTPRPRP